MLSALILKFVRAHVKGTKSCFTINSNYKSCVSLNAIKVARKVFFSALLYFLLAVDISYSDKLFMPKPIEQVISIAYTN